MPCNIQSQPLKISSTCVPNRSYVKFVPNHHELSNNFIHKRSLTSTTKHTKNEGKEVYVHPLSKIVLEHLQNSRFTWMKNVGVDQPGGGLKLNKDGTFMLKFPPSKDQIMKSSKSEDEDAILRERIWTYYDAKEKKHWLQFQKGELVGRYLMQDNLTQPWHSSKLSTPEKIQVAVDEMIVKFDES